MFSPDEVYKAQSEIYIVASIQSPIGQLQMVGDMANYVQNKYMYAEYTFIPHASCICALHIIIMRFARIRYLFYYFM